MNTSKIIIGLISACSLVAFSCSNSSNSGDKQISKNFHMEKKYWDAADYDAVLSELYTYREGKKYPNLSDVSTAEVFNKIADINNVSVVVEDTNLGISHRSKFATDMFENYRRLSEYYSKLDREDKYIYPLEIAKIELFGVYTEIYYFKLGNESLLKEAINPNSDEVKNTVNSNAQRVVNNMKISIDLCKKEDALTPEAIHVLNVGFEKYLSLLIQTFPNSDYSELKSQIDLLSSPVKSSETKEMLAKVKESITKIEKK